MHPKRRFILFRWVLALCIFLAGLGWVAYGESISLIREEKLPPMPQFTKINLPSEDQMQTLQQGIRASRSLQRRPPPRGVLTPAPELVVTTEEQKKITSRVELTMIVVGKGTSYAVLDGTIYETGDTLPDGRVVGRITPNSVVLRSASHKEVLHWESPLRVELRKAEPRAAPEPQAQEAQPQEQQPAQARQEDVQSLLQNRTAE